jgi:DNA mismatch repair protein MSH5
MASSRSRSSQQRSQSNGRGRWRSVSSRATTPFPRRPSRPPSSAQSPRTGSSEPPGSFVAAQTPNPSLRANARIRDLTPGNPVSLLGLGPTTRPPRSDTTPSFVSVATEIRSEGHTHNKDQQQQHMFSDEEPDSLNEVIMAINMKNNGSVGCAYYVAAEEVLFLLEDVEMAGAEIVETLLIHASPTTVIIPSRASKALSNILEPGSYDAGQNGSEGESIKARCPSTMLTHRRPAYRGLYPSDPQGSGLPLRDRKREATRN